MNARLLSLGIMFSVAGACAPAAYGASALTMGYGWSVNPDPVVAVDEAVAMLKQRVRAPHFIFAMTQMEYDDGAIATRLRTALPEARVLGYEVSFAVFAPDGVHRGEKGAIALVGFEAPTWRIGTAAADMSAATQPEAIKAKAAEVLEKAVAGAGKTKKDRPSVLLLAPTKLKEELILRAVEDMFGKDVKIMGGTPGAPKVFTQEGAVDEGFGVAAIYTELKVGVSFHAGVQIDKDHNGVVTAVGDSNRILKEIDRRPAFDVYNDWTGGVFKNVDVDNLKEPMPVWIDAGRTPLVTLYDMGEGSYGTNVVVPIKILKDRSLVLGADLNLGATVYNSLSSQKAYAKRAGTIVRQALADGRIKKSHLAGGIHVYCRGAALGQLGQSVESLTVVVEETKKEMGATPFIGGFTAGEQGSIRGHGYFHGNMSSSMVVFGDE
jgi:hypothetical protein